MPYTSHGHPYGNTSPDEPRPDRVARCGGPAICRQCATEANRATAAPEEPRRDGQLLHVNAITGDDRHPTTATQWAVGHPDGRHTCYGDQEWVACGQAAEEDGPGSTTMYRSVTITYGPWVEVSR